MAAKDSKPRKTLDLLVALIAGFNKGAPLGQPTVAAGGKAFAMPELVSKLDQYRTVYDTADKAEKARVTAVEEREKIEPEVTTFLGEVTTALKGMLGPRNPALDDYGVKPEKAPTPLTTEQQAQKVAKAKATRIARHTMGKKQKKAIKGQVQGP